jgi:hypothetical protein
MKLDGYNVISIPKYPLNLTVVLEKLLDTTVSGDFSHQIPYGVLERRKK